MFPLIFGDDFSGRLSIFAGGDERSGPIHPPTHRVEGVAPVVCAVIDAHDSVVVSGSRLELLERELHLALGCPRDGRTLIPTPMTHLEPMLMVDFVEVARDGGLPCFREQLGLDRRGRGRQLRDGGFFDNAVILRFVGHLAIDIDAEHAIVATGVGVGHMLPSLGGINSGVSLAVALRAACCFAHSANIALASLVEDRSVVAPDAVPRQNRSPALHVCRGLCVQPCRGGEWLLLVQTILEREAAGHHLELRRRELLLLVGLEEDAFSSLHFANVRRVVDLHKLAPERAGVFDFLQRAEGQIVRRDVDELVLALLLAAEGPMRHFLGEVTQRHLRKKVAHVRGGEVKERNPQVLARLGIDDVRAVFFERVELAPEVSRLVPPMLERSVLGRLGGEGLGRLLDFRMGGPATQSNHREHA